MQGDPGLPGTALFPPPEERDALRTLLARALDAAREAMPGSSVVPCFDRAQFEGELARFTFASPMRLAEVLPWVVQQMREGNVQITHPRYFGLFNPAPAFPAELGEQIVAAFNPQLAAAATSPAAIAIEAHVIGEIARRAGLPPGSGGHFTNNGSEANFTALITALTKANPAFRQDGARAFRSPPRIYISQDAHLAWIKIAQLAGIGRGAVRQIETDGMGRMCAEALAAAVRADVEQGAVPVMIVATAGTTVAGMVDPMAACAGIARSAGAWLHVDAAWGGAAIASDRLRGKLAGIELAHSVTIDAHKWFATTMSCGMFITAEPSVLAESFNVTASFMPYDASGGIDPYATSVMWSRRFLGLRLFLNLAAAGWPGYASHVERATTLIGRLRARLTAAGWCAANPDGLGVLCAAPPPGAPPVPVIVRTVLASGQAWISAARFEGHDVVRICVTNGQSGDADADVLADLLAGAAGGEAELRHPARLVAVAPS